MRLKELILQFGENNVVINKEEINVRGVNNFSFWGKNEVDGSSVIFSVLDDDIQGTITTNNGVYQIETIGKNNITQAKSTNRNTQYPNTRFRFCSGNLFFNYFVSKTNKNRKNNH
jgi:hypothetical protein